MTTNAYKDKVVAAVGAIRALPEIHYADAPTLETKDGTMYIEIILRVSGPGDWKEAEPILEAFKAYVEKRPYDPSKA